MRAWVRITQRRSKRSLMALCRNTTIRAPSSREETTMMEDKFWQRSNKAFWIATIICPRARTRLWISLFYQLSCRKEQVSLAKRVTLNGLTWRIRTQPILSQQQECRRALHSNSNRAKEASKGWTQWIGQQSAAGSTDYYGVFSQLIFQYLSQALLFCF